MQTAQQTLLTNTYAASLTLIAMSGFLHSSASAQPEGAYRCEMRDNGGSFERFFKDDAWPTSDHPHCAQQGVSVYQTWFWHDEQSPYLKVKSLCGAFVLTLVRQERQEQIESTHVEAFDLWDIPKNDAVNYDGDLTSVDTIEIRLLNDAATSGDDGSQISLNLKSVIENIFSKCHTPH